MSNRRANEFPARVRALLAKRAAQTCSNPECRKLTSGPGHEPSTAVTIGVAAHLSAASPGGPRYDASLAPDERRSIVNGIWLCQNCARLIDSDPSHFTLSLLQSWKRRHERFVSLEISSRGTRDRAGLSAPGLLTVSDIQVREDAESGLAVLDFRVSNSGGSDVLINRVTLEAMETLHLLMLGQIEYSAIYDVDLSGVRQVGQVVECMTEQLIKPGEADRFGLSLAAPELGAVVCALRLRPKLYTNFGAVEGPDVEVWLPPGKGFHGLEQTKEEIRRTAMLSGAYLLKIAGRGEAEAEEELERLEPVLEELFDALDAGELTDWPTLIARIKEAGLTPPLAEDLRRLEILEEEPGEIGGVLTAVALGSVCWVSSKVPFFENWDSMIADAM